MPNYRAAKKHFLQDLTLIYPILPKCIQNYHILRKIFSNPHFCIKIFKKIFQSSKTNKKKFFLISSEI